MEHLQKMLAALAGDTSKLVIDLSCRRRDGTWFVATEKWQTITDMEITNGSVHVSSLPLPCADGR